MALTRTPLGGSVDGLHRPRGRVGGGRRGRPRLPDKVALAGLRLERVARGGGLAGHADEHPLHPDRLPVLILACLAPVVVEAVAILRRVITKNWE